MEIESIQNLRNIRNTLRTTLKEFKTQEFNGKKFGSELEYNAKGIIAGADAIVTDVATLIRSPKQFLQSSSYEERTELNSLLVKLNSELKTKNLSNVCVQIEKLKTVLRPYAIRYDDKRLHEFINYTNTLQKSIQEFNELLESAKETKSKTDELHIETKNIKESISEHNNKIGIILSELEESIEETNSLRADSKTSLESDLKNSEEIYEILDTVRTQAQTIESFADEVKAREEQLLNQSAQTKIYIDKLVQYTEERDEYLLEAKQLITSAKQALEYKTAEGLSSAFSTQYDKSGSKIVATWWVTCTILFLIAAVALGYVITLSQDIADSVILARISLIPILIGGSIFSANQYTRQKRIADDYAYKMVLAKSLVGFSEQLSSQEDKGNEYQLYIKSVLSQILTDPQRTRAKISNNAKLTNDELDIEKTLNTLKEMPEQMKKIVKLLESK